MEVKVFMKDWTMYDESSAAKKENCLTFVRLRCTETRTTDQGWIWRAEECSLQPERKWKWFTVTRLHWKHNTHKKKAMRGQRKHPTMVCLHFALISFHFTSSSEFSPFSTQTIVNVSDFYLSFSNINTYFLWKISLGLSSRKNASVSLI